jgi:hypothetical protein
MSTCRGCGEPIEFIVTRKGRRMPVDPELDTMALIPGRVVITPEGDVLRGSEATTRMMVQGYVSHFATCAFAEAFRTPRP